VAVAELARGQVMAVRKTTAGAMTGQYPDDVTVRRLKIKSRRHLY